MGACHHAWARVHAPMYAAIDCSRLGQPPSEITTSITSVMLKEERKATCQALFLLTLSLKLKVKVNRVNRVQDPDPVARSAVSVMDWRVIACGHTGVEQRREEGKEHSCLPHRITLIMWV